jgi:hypothetical protein
VGAASTNTEIKTSGLTAEASPPSNATVEVCGVQGATGDIEIDADGNIISTALDFTTLNLPAYSWIKIGGDAAAQQFATTAYNRIAKIVSVAANKITLERRNWTVGAADAGAGKTIRLHFGRWYRNVSIDHADYREPTMHGELEELGPGPSGVATYAYAYGMALNVLTLNAALESKITATLAFVAKDVKDPVLVASRATGADAPRRPMAARLFHTSSPHLIRARVAVKSSDASLVAEVNSWQWSMNNNIKPREIQGELGAIDMIYGKYVPSASMEIYYTTYELAAAMRTYPDCTFDAQFRNDQAGVVIDMPCVKVRNPEGRTFAANEAVMCSLEVPGYRDQDSNIVASWTVFPHLPAAPT